MKTKFLKVVFILLAVALLSATFVGCGLTEEEKALVGIYELIEINVEGNPTLNANSYEYYYINLKDNGKCAISRKSSGESYDAEASWKINKQGDVEILIVVGRSKVTEIYKIEKDDILAGENTAIFNGAPTLVTTKFQRSLEDVEM